MGEYGSASRAMEWGEYHTYETAEAWVDSTNGNSSVVAGTDANSDFPLVSYSGSGDYLEEDGEFIKVDKGSPDKAKYAIFYAVDEDPVIFVKNRKQLEKELDKLIARPEVVNESIRVFKLVGAVRKVKNGLVKKRVCKKKRKRK